MFHGCLSLLKERVAGTYTYTKKQSFPLLNIVREMVMIFHSYCTNEFSGMVLTFDNCMSTWDGR